MNRKVILILADGMRPDSMAHLPYVQELMKKSAYSMKAETTFPSVTLPCHFSLFLSVPAERHGISTNLYMPPVRPINGLLEQLAAAGKRSTVYYDWEQLRDLWRPGSVELASYLKGDYEVNDEKHTVAALSYIEEKSPDFVFLYLGNPDCAGHDHGWMSGEYMKSVEGVWNQIERVIESCSDEYTIIVTADHGGHERRHGENIPEDMLIPLMLLGPDFAPGEIEHANIMDIAPTIAKLMGANCAHEWEGKPLI
ncbi:MAG: alkaline phosphatase family protein [Oscillospiraceae bacterium]|nr:alkaline phosphatase family protein [Oscillospiraceae bacterium]